MAEFYGSFLRNLYRDESSGKTIFAIETNDETAPKQRGYSGTKCVGYIMNLPKGLPVKIIGEVKKDYILADEIIPQTSDEAAAYSFLNSKIFHGIGPKTSAAIIKVVGHEIFSFCSKETAINDLQKIPGVTQKVATDLVLKVREYKNLQELVRYMTSFGATYSSAKKIYEKYGDNSMSKIKENPYILYFAEVDFENREAIAKKSGISDLDPRRIGAIIHEAMDRIESSGNTCTTIKELMETIEHIEKSANMNYESSVVSVLAYIISHKNKFEIKVYGDTSYIYRTYLARLENKAANHVIRLCQSGSFIGITKPYQPEGVKFDKVQKDAFSILDQSGISILTGGPGTGKSTLINGFIKAYEKAHPNNIISLCAPTGAAAKRLKEVTDRKAVTIHKLLDARPYGRGELQYRDEYNQLGSDLIIVDEFSMVDTELFTMLCSAIKSGALLLLVGDEDQLPSVGPGNLLKELLENEMVRVKKLNKTYRQSGSSTILQNAIEIRRGGSNLKTDNTFIIERVSSSVEMEELALRYMEKAVNQKDKFKIKLYSPIKKRQYNIGTFNLNSKIHEMANGKEIKSFIYNGTKFAINDPVVFLKNNYKKGYLNGDEGTITDIIKKEDDDVIAEIETSEGNKIVLKDGELIDIDLAYCVTIHKSQGSESDAGVILIPKRPKGLLKRNLIYVAITRAKKQNIIISENDALENAVKESLSSDRKTNLNNRIRENIMNKINKR